MPVKDDAQALADRISLTLQPLGYDLIRLALIKGRPLTVQIFIEHSDYQQAITVEDCGYVSRNLSPVLDSLIAGDYQLEVSSPGIERPLTRLKDFDRFKESEISLELSPGTADRRRYTGILKGLDSEERIILETSEQTFFLPFSALKRANLKIR